MHKAEAYIVDSTSMALFSETVARSKGSGSAFSSYAESSSLTWAERLFSKMVGISKVPSVLH